MNATTTIFDNIPETITIPKEFVHKKGEIIIIVNENISDVPKKSIKNFFGILPDFPERFSQGNFENRDFL